ncbi:tRNA uridine(34) 5-carboxymethylaminomethyl modification radical SAM/GNAT enzyme Elp3 [Methanocorpusculum bavaricum]|uniref:tRNA uridine(34) 5-carboxymethylaminomethyl modification radical SAM/GNAT enzyme Elp3 n=1 Tax=Methanocorpusculum bavaricum TaxID=71518 RepID=UPI0005B2725C|nr:tRNA uridine(34) 5-carboxymethylaminomethyl modification radical SAM/GNAT enzyme Elp3 [Methanocorpusculum bavaricum]
MDEHAVYREIISRIFSDPEPDIQHIKLSICRRYALDVMPKNSAILGAAKPEEYEALRRVLMVKPTRTLSGVAPVAVMTSPCACPHGKCLPCPGGPDHVFQSPQSYTGEEPAALRARQNEYDPYRQVTARLGQFKRLGHHVDKAELIVMGGTMTARDDAYQVWFVSECLRAMNEFSGNKSAAGSVEELMLENEKADVRCIATTFETRPDWCRKEHINKMLDLGVTKVELGFQHTEDELLLQNKRGHTVGDSVRANTLLRDAGIKVGFHVMPNLYGSTIPRDREMFDTLFTDPRFCPDFLKIYPTLVTPGAELEELWKRGEYVTYDEDELVDLLAYAKSRLPEYVRLQRVQRDIPAKLIVSGSIHGHIRQMAAARLKEQGGSCRCIRCREIGRRPSSAVVEEKSQVYSCCGGTEHFLSTVAGESLIGFVRLRFPGTVFRPELEEAALVRELHVYGEIVPLGESGSGDKRQHRSYGQQLLKRAEETAREAGYSKVAVMSGVGVRPYYHRQGYQRTGPYMIKNL